MIGDEVLANRLGDLEDRCERRTISRLIEQIECDLGECRRISLQPSSTRQMRDDGLSPEQAIDLGAKQSDLGAQDVLGCLEIGAFDELLGGIGLARHDLSSCRVDQHGRGPLVAARIRLHQMICDLDRVSAASGQDLRRVGVGPSPSRSRHLCIHALSLEGMQEGQWALPTEHSDISESIRQLSAFLAIDAGNGYGNAQGGGTEYGHRLQQIQCAGRHHGRPGEHGSCHEW